MKTYIVGGWVRDRLLREAGYAVSPTDKDWVVVDSSPEEMTRRGFVPVGADFPVFINPETGEEYALARTERKTGKGYHGFCFHASPDVTLEQDLERRDLTINAIAQDSSGNLIDPFGGIADLRKKILRHVSPAFSEDPVRLLRLARFSARFPDFEIASETLDLTRRIVDSGEADALVPERVGAELLKALKEDEASVFFETLRASGYWQRAYPDWNISPETLRMIDGETGEKRVQIRFALMFRGLSAGRAKELFKRFKPSRDLMDLALLYVNWAGRLPGFHSPLCEIVDFLTKIDCLRRMDRFLLLLDCERMVLSERERLFLCEAAGAFKALDAGKVIAAGRDKTNIPKLLGEARAKEVARVLDKFGDQ